MMADDFRRERLRRAGEIRGYNPSATTGSPAHAGIALSASTVPGKVLKYHPIIIRGTESEGSTGVIDTRTANRYATNLGPATVVTNDMLVIRSVGWRWVCEKTTPSGSGILLPGCPCSSPTSLTMTSTTTSNSNIFNSALLAYGLDPTSLSLGMGMYSTIPFVDIITLDSYWYHFFCSGGLFCLHQIYQTSVYGSPYISGITMHWQNGVNGNTCSPFYLPGGIVFSGGDPSANSHVVISG